MNEFVHLHVHTVHSPLDGLTRMPELASRVKKLGMRAVAVTDHGSMAGIPKLWDECKEVGVKPIAGVEAYICEDMTAKGGGKSEKAPYYHITLIAKNQAGYRNLCRLSAASYKDGFYSKPRIDLARLAKHREGIVALSGCIGGWSQQHIIAGRNADADKVIGNFKEVFGREFFLEMQETGEPEQRIVNKAYHALAKRHGLGLALTGDSHYTDKADSEHHDTLICMGTRKLKSTPAGKGFKEDKSTRMKFVPEQYYIKSAAEMYKLGFDKSAYTNTLRIAEMCETYELPRAKGLPRGDKWHDSLVQLALDGLYVRFPAPSETTIARLMHELDVVRDLNYSSYFVMIEDVVAWARKQGMFIGWGRGSSAGSLLAYCLFITDINPLEYGLYFERFLNKHRAEPPDIDLDFTDEDRPAIIEYLHTRYGREKVAQVGTYSTLGPRQVLIDSGTALEIPDVTIRTAISMLPKDPLLRIAGILESDGLVETLTETLGPEVMSCMEKFDSIPRHASVHAAGVIIDTESLDGKLPFMGKDTGTATQFTYDDLHALGYEKFDILGVRTLRVIRDACEIAGVSDRGFPLDDEETYLMLCAGATTGVFQYESWGYKKFLREFKPMNFNDIMMCNALYRPGPMQGGQGLELILARRFGRRPIEYFHPKVKPIVQDTYGVMVYQEQVMAVVQALAGWSLEDADLMRRAIGKKKQDELHEMRKKFVDDCVKNQLTHNEADDAFNLIDFFARYGWNKSHAAAYGMVTYVTAYLKANYPEAFMIAQLNADAGDTDRVGELLKECNAMNLKICRPCVNASSMGYKFTVNGIMAGLLAIRGIGQKAAEWIVGERDHGPFTSMENFRERIPKTVVNRLGMEALLKWGAFANLDEVDKPITEVVPF